MDRERSVQSRDIERTVIILYGHCTGIRIFPHFGSSEGCLLHRTFFSGFIFNCIELKM